MHKSFAAGLLAAAALIPGLANAQSWHGRDGRDRDHNQAEQPAPAPRPQAQPRFQPRPAAPQQPQQRPTFNRPPAANYDGRGQAEWRGRNPGYNQPRAPGPVRHEDLTPRAPGTSNYAGWRERNAGVVAAQERRDRGDDRGWQNRPNRGNGNQWQGRDGRDRDHQAGNWQGNRGNGWGNRPGANRGGQWNREWRHNGQYDWNRYRAQNRYHYRLPRYYAPRGWGYGYQRYGIGVVLNDLFFQPTYWIDDAYDYRLPPAYGPYRWVRYYNDALLVDIDSGEVVDAVYGIFW